jgi:hypothetical protein
MRKMHENLPSVKFKTKKTIHFIHHSRCCVLFRFLRFEGSGIQRQLFSYIKFSLTKELQTPNRLGERNKEREKMGK